MSNGSIALSASLAEFSSASPSAQYESVSMTSTFAPMRFISATLASTI